MSVVCLRNFPGTNRAPKVDDKRILKIQKGAKLRLDGHAIIHWMIFLGCIVDEHKQRILKFMGTVWYRFELLR